MTLENTSLALTVFFFVMVTNAHEMHVCSQLSPSTPTSWDCCVLQNIKFLTQDIWKLALRHWSVKELSVASAKRNTSHVKLFMFYSSQ
jgi:hypothetical protein